MNQIEEIIFAIGVPVELLHPNRLSHGHFCPVNARRSSMVLSPHLTSPVFQNQIGAKRTFGFRDRLSIPEWPLLRRSGCLLRRQALLESGSLGGTTLELAKELVLRSLAQRRTTTCLRAPLGPLGWSTPPREPQPRAARRVSLTGRERAHQGLFWLPRPAPRAGLVVRCPAFSYRAAASARAPAAARRDTQYSEAGTTSSPGAHRRQSALGVKQSTAKPLVPGDPLALLAAGQRRRARTGRAVSGDGQPTLRGPRCRGQSRSGQHCGRVSMRRLRPGWR
jgi:hypothetical protein